MSDIPIQIQDILDLLTTGDKESAIGDSFDFLKNRMISFRYRYWRNAKEKKDNKDPAEEKLAISKVSKIEIEKDGKKYKVHFFFQDPLDIPFYDSTDIAISVSFSKKKVGPIETEFVLMDTETLEKRVFKREMILSSFDEIMVSKLD